MDEEEKKDLILLDARLTHQVSVHAFRAELANGHGLVAYFREQPVGAGPRIGETVRVFMSPYDMSVGRMIFEDVS